ncbi:riboflavin synthase [Gelria sp. Kuro-4]|uniref:riboflavin synthase n=1 Tax=Gelria sp. Kuro-4 TaxID=2796927 RepID=UPI001BEF1819|nr:riboflavin synthase [Gelria sp. Kuro-4]BCV25687.1 riboflavin synthase [Gelria sp. Kuro-4]
MFTGLVETMGKVKELRLLGRRNQLVIEEPGIAQQVKLGDSVAINGVCLTVVQCEGDRLIFDVMPETLRKTNLRSLTRGDYVNMERALAMGDRLGGHLLTGHIDGVGQVSARRTEGNAIIFTIHAPEEVTSLLVEKGSVAVDGISLTVGDLEPKGFWVSIIPHTLENTVLQHRRPGDKVNLEADLIGKYVLRYLKRPAPGSPGGITLDFLGQHGFLS